MNMTYHRMILLVLVVLAWRSAGLAAEAKPAWQADWDKTVAAAKKEGRLNFYVGRYGSEPLLNEFRKEFPEIKLVTVNGVGQLVGNQDHHRDPRRPCGCRSVQRRRQYQL